MTDLPRTSRKRQQTRDRLMDAAYQLFAEEGIHATSIEAITEAAGFTRGAFYSNFESKEGLFFALADREWGQRLTLLREVIDEFSGTAAELGEQITELLLAVFSVVPDDRTWALIYREFELLALRDPQIAPQFLAHQHQFHHQLTEVLTFAAERFSVTFTLDASRIAVLLALWHEHVMRSAMLADPRGAESTARDELVRSIPPLLELFTRGA